MIRTILWYTFFWLYQLVSLSFFIPLALLRLVKLKEREEAYIHYVTSSWTRHAQPTTLRLLHSEFVKQQADDQTGDHLNQGLE